MSSKLIFRNVGACIAAIVAVFALLIAVEIFSEIVHPTPAGFTGTIEEMCAHVANYPNWVLALVVPMWGLIAFVGTWIAGRAGGRISAIIIALLILAAAACNITMLPYAAWFKIAQPVAILGAIALGYRMAITPKSAVAY